MSSFTSLCTWDLPQLYNDPQKYVELRPEAFKKSPVLHTVGVHHVVSFELNTYPELARQKWCELWVKKLVIVILIDAVRSGNESRIYSQTRTQPKQPKLAIELHHRTIEALGFRHSTVLRTMYFRAPWAPQTFLHFSNKPPSQVPCPVREPRHPVGFVAARLLGVLVRACAKLVLAAGIKSTDQT